MHETVRLVNQLAELAQSPLEVLQIRVCLLVAQFMPHKLRFRFRADARERYEPALFRFDQSPRMVSTPHLAASIELDDWIIVKEHTGGPVLAKTDYDGRGVWLWLKFDPVNKRNRLKHQVFTGAFVASHTKENSQVQVRSRGEHHRAFGRNGN